MSSELKNPNSGEHAGGAPGAGGEPGKVFGHHEHGHYLPVEHEHVDDWHSHSAAEGTPQAEHGKIANPAVLAAWFVGLVVAVVAFVGVTVLYFNHYTTRYKAEQFEKTTLAADYLTYKTSTLESGLHLHGWVDAREGVVQIPIRDAMRKVVEKYGRGEQPARLPAPETP